MLRRKCDAITLLAGEKRAPADQECARTHPRDFCERGLKIVQARHSYHDDLKSDRTRCSLKVRNPELNAG